MLPLRGDRAKASEASARSRRQGQIQGQKGASWRKIPLAGGRRPAGQADGRVKALPRGELTISFPPVWLRSASPEGRALAPGPCQPPAHLTAGRIAPAAGPSQNPNFLPSRAPPATSEPFEGKTLPQVVESAAPWSKRPPTGTLASKLPLPRVRIRTLAAVDAKSRNLSAQNRFTTPN